MTRSTCQDCGTDYTGTPIMMCVQCGGANIKAEVLAQVYIPTMPVPDSLQPWLKKVSKYVQRPKE